MRFTLHDKPSIQAGFTLVEMLIVTPIMIVVIGTFIVLTINMTGDALAARDHNELIFSNQRALDQIEQDVRISGLFMSDSDILPSPQGSDNGFKGTAAFTASSGALILNALTTDRNPFQSGREPIFLADQPYPCGVQQNPNKVFTQRIIYFINNGSLWRRVIVPPYNTTAMNTVCSTPWQLNSCSRDASGSVCQSVDSEVAKNVQSISVQYYSTNGSIIDLGPADASSAAAINVAITSSRVSAGKTITHWGTVRISKLNKFNL